MRYQRLHPKQQIKDIEKNRPHNREEEVEDDVSDLTTKSQETKLTKMQESFADMEGKLEASVKENEKLPKQLKEIMVELAKKKLSPESLMSQGTFFGSYNRRREPLSFN